jgi:hypothetical protein
MSKKQQQSEWSKETLIENPDLAMLFDRLARIGRAVQRGRAKAERARNCQAEESKS